MIDFSLSPMRADRTLLTTSTGEPFQPVRLTYSIPGKAFVTNVFSKLSCMAEDREAGRWGWFYTAEAAALEFGLRSEERRDNVEPIVIGICRFPKKSSMTLELRSVTRAIEAAKFFGPILGPKVVARRARIVNRYFDGSELTGNLADLDKHLDQNVTVIDPRVAEAKLDEYLAEAKTPEQAKLAYERYYDDRRKERRDVPLVDDFPLAPQEETPDFKHLTIALQLRLFRAHEHWNGNPIILRDILEQLMAKDTVGRME
ncbi:MAG TPA: hypothetical protein PK156_41750 [Polyangium sp.]|nr:hypothetical protein [Polyangium sp.]